MIASIVLLNHPVLSAWAQSIASVITLAGLWWASQFAKRPKSSESPQRRIKTIEGIVGTKQVCNPGRRFTDRCAGCPLPGGCPKHLPPVTPEELLRDRASVALLEQQILAYPDDHPAVLYVEDNALLGELVSVLFVQAGIRFRIAHSLEEALPIRASDMVLMTDWRLPDGTGAEVIAAYRAVHYNRPVVVVSALDQDLGNAPPHVMWLAKPFDPDEFVLMAEQLLKQ